MHGASAVAERAEVVVLAVATTQEQIGAPAERLAVPVHQVNGAPVWRVGDLADQLPQARWVEASVDRARREHDPSVRLVGLADRVVIDSRHPAVASSMVFSVCQPIKDCTIPVPAPGRLPVNRHAAKILMPITAPWKVLEGVKRAVWR